MRFLIYCIAVVAVLLLFSSCKHTVNFDEYPAISFATSVSPVIISNCTQSGCHGNKQSESFKLLAYDDIIRHGRITPGSPNKSNLYSVIKTLNKNERMPIPPLNPLTNEQIKTIYLWIGQGAKNN